MNAKRQIVILFLIAGALLAACGPGQPGGATVMPTPQSPTSAPTPVPTETPMPTLVPDEMVRLTVTVWQGVETCAGLRYDFEIPFRDEILRRLGARGLGVMFYSVEQSYGNWPPDTGLNSRGCIAAGEQTPPGTYDVRFEMTLYKELPTNRTL